MPRANRGMQIKERADRPGIWEVGEYAKGKWKRHRTGLGSAGEAEEARYCLERQKRVGQVFELNERMIADTLADYIDEHRPSVGSKTTFDITMQHLAAFWADKTLAHITEGTCNAYYAFRNKAYRQRQAVWNKKYKKDRPIQDISDSTVGRELRQLRAAIERDANTGRIVHKPKVWVRKENNAKPEIPFRKDVILMARRAKPGSPRRMYILLAFYTGARKGAVLGLRWPQIDGRHIDFNPPGTPLSNKKRPVVPMNRKLKLLMQIWRRRGTDLGPVIHVNQKPIKDLKDCPTSLRHAAAVQMLISGVPDYTVAQYIGNSAEMIRKHYGKFIPGHLADAAEALG